MLQGFCARHLLYGYEVVEDEVAVQNSLEPIDADYVSGT